MRRASVIGALRLTMATVLAAALALSLLGGGLDIAPRIGMAAPVATEPPRRPPLLPLVVPPNAPEDAALWTYLYRIAPLWDQDWATVIELLEQFLARYPGNEAATEKLYAAYVEDGRARQRAGDAAGARQRYHRATQLAPDRGEAWSFLDELDMVP